MLHGSIKHFSFALKNILQFSSQIVDGYVELIDLRDKVNY